MHANITDLTAKEYRPVSEGRIRNVPTLLAAQEGGSARMTKESEEGRRRERGGREEGGGKEGRGEGREEGGEGREGGGGKEGRGRDGRKGEERRGGGREERIAHLSSTDP